MKYRGFLDLQCYIQARLLRIFISQLVRKFPAQEKYLLTPQIIDSSRSITRNIAEGYGRFSYVDTSRFFVIARGSVTETIEHLITANDENYISESELKEGQNKCELVFKLINGYINYLEKFKPNKKNSSIQ